MKFQINSNAVMSQHDSAQYEDGSRAGLWALKRAGHDLYLSEGMSLKDLPGIFIDSVGDPEADKIIDSRSIPPPLRWISIAGLYGKDLAVGDVCSVLHGDERSPGVVTGVPRLAMMDDEALFDVSVKLATGETFEMHVPWDKIVAPI